ncbi:MAG TPA: hypothetical protein VH834_20740 [Solirubrobacteraceae bacterium]
MTATRTALAALAAAAIAAPSAAAQPIDQVLPSGNEQTPAPDVVTRTVKVDSSGFDWGDAGLGAVGMLSALALGAGAVVVARRGQTTVS